MGCGEGVADVGMCVGGCCEGQGTSHKPGCKTIIKEVRMKKSKDSLSWGRTNINEETGSARLGEGCAEEGPAWACIRSSCYWG